jgi:hypothetical protein
LKLTSGTLKFSDVTSPEDAKKVAEFLRETLLPLPLFYMTKIEGTAEEGTTIEFRRRSE